MSMAKDAYANYVVKTALEVLEEGPQRDQIYGELLSNLAELVSFVIIESTLLLKVDFISKSISCPIPMRAVHNFKGVRPIYQTHRRNDQGTPACVIKPDARTSLADMKKTH